MRLKTLTTVLVLFGIVMLFLMVWLFKQMPPNTATRKEQADFGVRLITGFGLTALTWLGAATCAYLLARKTRIEYAEQRAEALKSLVEGSLKDHESH